MFVVMFVSLFVSRTMNAGIEFLEWLTRLVDRLHQCFGYTFYDSVLIQVAAPIFWEGNPWNCYSYNGFDWFWFKMCFYILYLTHSRNTCFLARRREYNISLLQYINNKIVAGRLNWWILYGTELWLIKLYNLPWTSILSIFLLGMNA